MRQNVFAIEKIDHCALSINREEQGDGEIDPLDAYMSEVNKEMCASKYGVGKVNLFFRTDHFYSQFKAQKKIVLISRFSFTCYQLFVIGEMRMS